MKKDSKKVGIELILVSAFRSIKRQQELINDKRKKGIPDKEIFKVLAPAGHSEHHTGCALDLHTPNSAILEEDFEKTSAFAWLNKNAGLYGFELSYPRDNPTGLYMNLGIGALEIKVILLLKINILPPQLAVQLQAEQAALQHESPSPQQPLHFFSQSQAVKANVTKPNTNILVIFFIMTISL